VIFDEPVSHRDSLAKKAVAFLNFPLHPQPFILGSQSSSSASTAAAGPGSGSVFPCVAPPVSCVRHFRGSPWPTPNRRDTSPTLSRCCVISATASTLNSRVNLRRSDIGSLLAHYSTRFIARPQFVGKSMVFDATADAKPADVNKGLDRVARLLNLYGAAGLKAQDVKIMIVLHGEATKSVLSDTAYKARFQVDENPNLPLIRELL
jgi:hypothetical protein